MQKSARCAEDKQESFVAERQAFHLERATELYQQQLYNNFLDMMYTLHRDSELNDSAKPWKFANACYRAILISRQNCATGCKPKLVKDIISLNGLQQLNQKGLRMEVNINDFQCNCHYVFAVRAISIHNGIGPFCAPVKIFTGNTLVDHH
ncbi:unnamed protein product [Rotaria sordida]|uniref:Uncharacterized protein n=1 Tax=Rotaria sordida TaxID=392033 RepID=A0A820C5A1_9BILA|nr:unnamed protein product [Rotaria sordida]